MSQEEWRPVSGWPYEVSNQGRVRRSSAQLGRTRVGKVLRPGIGSPGYPFVVLCQNGQTKGFNVHALVAEAFIGPRPEGWVVDHMDRDRTNNNVENLRYLTREENGRQGGYARHGIHWQP